MGESSLMLNEPFGEGLTGRDARPSYRDVVVYLHVSGLDELHAIHTKLTKAGAAPSECRDEMYGQREFTVRDPDGYEIAFATPLG